MGEWQGWYVCLKDGRVRTTAEQRGPGGRASFEKSKANSSLNTCDVHPALRLSAGSLKQGDAWNSPPLLSPALIQLSLTWLPPCLASMGRAPLTCPLTVTLASQG